MTPDWGIPCRICGWSWWRETVERFVLRNRNGETIRRRNGRFTRSRVVSPLLFTEEHGWVCKHCVRRCGIKAQSAAAYVASTIPA